MSSWVSSHVTFQTAVQLSLSQVNQDRLKCHFRGQTEPISSQYFRCKAGSISSHYFRDQTGLSHFAIKLWLQNRDGRLTWYRCDVRDQTGPGRLTSWPCCDVRDQTGTSHALISMRYLRTKYINVFVTKTCHFRAYGVRVLHDQFVISEIKQGHACSGAGHDTMCVAGAECVSGSCTCKSSVYTSDATTGKCSEYKVTHQIHTVQTSS